MKTMKSSKLKYRLLKTKSMLRAIPLDLSEDIVWATSPTKKKKELDLAGIHFAWLVFKVYNSCLLLVFVLTLLLGDF